MTTGVRRRAERLEVGVLRSFRRVLGRPPVVAGARGLSLVGEHAGGWLILGAAGWARGRHRPEWSAQLVGVLLAHAAAVLLKRVVRRVRPQVADVPALVRTPSRLSFPSAHAASTAAAAYGCAPLVGRRLPGGVLLAMCLSRVLLGVHWPGDVVVGAGLGLGVAATVRRVLGRRHPSPPGRNGVRSGRAWDSMAG